MADEGFHEVQLNGKQLIFLFMTAAVVLVVTFLCGVLVGRGVRAQKEPTAASDAAPGAMAAADPTAAVTSPPVATKAATPTPPAVPPPQPEEDLSYYARLEGKSAPAATVKSAPKDAKSTDAKSKTATPAAAATPKPADPSAAATAQPPGTGYSLKIAAYKDKAQADALAERLSAKGYSTYVVPATSKGSALYSVRVGTFQTRKDADAAKRRLEKEEQFKPLITR